MDVDLEQHSGSDDARIEQGKDTLEDRLVGETSVTIIEEPLTFNTLHADRQTCRCLDGLEVEAKQSYIRKSILPHLSDNCMLTYWELGKVKPKYTRDNMKCSDVRAYKGLSVFVVDNRAQVLMEEFRNFYGSAPQYAHRYIHIVTFTKRAGVIDRFGSKYNINHRNFWKSDSFSLAEVQTRQTIDLNDV